MNTKIDISHILKFDGTYFNIWKHKLTLLFKFGKIMAYVNGTKAKPIVPIVAQIVARAIVLPAIGIGSIVEWYDKDAIAIQVINNCSDNNIISNVQLKTTSHDVWQELIKMFETQDAVTKMFLRDNLQTLKMREGESVVKHIQSFRSLLEQLLVIGAPITNVDVVLSLMQYMPLSYRNLYPPCGGNLILICNPSSHTFFKNKC
jgi:hypothetical protein